VTGRSRRVELGIGFAMDETIGGLLAVGNVAEVFEWGSRVLKLYKSTAAKPTAVREAAIHAAVEALGLPDLSKMSRASSRSC
jgi:hypothetical protein